MIVHVDVLGNMHTCTYKSKAYTNTIINLVHAKSMEVDPIFDPLFCMQVQESVS